MPSRERSRICEVPSGNVLLPHRGLGDAISSNQVSLDAVAVELLRGYGRHKGTAAASPAFDHVAPTRPEFRPRQQRPAPVMDSLSGYAHRPFSFVLRYLRQRQTSHMVILVAVVAAVGCSVGTQYGVKSLVDCLSAGPSKSGNVWLAFVLLMSFIAADNSLWRVASWTASFTFVGVTGDLRRDMFRHLTGHAPSYFSDRLPGMLTSRITATSNAVFTVENMFVWNVLPPCFATVSAIALISTVSPMMAGGLVLIAGTMVIALFRLAAGGKTFARDLCNKGAAGGGGV